MEILISVRAYINSSSLSNYMKAIGVYGAVRQIYRKLIDVTKPETVTVSVDGVDTQINTETIREYNVATGKLEEREAIEDILAHVESGDTVYDVGAHVGLFTCLLAKRLDEMGSSGSVVAFDPHPNNFHKLNENVDLNDIGGTVQTHRVALSNESGSVQFSTETQEAGATHGQIVTTEDVSTREVIETPVDIGDSFVRDSSRDAPDVMKIDVEGAELDVLRGLRGLLEEQKLKHVYVEIHDNHITSYGDSSDEVLEFLEDVGYECTVVQPGAENRTVRASRVA